MINFWIAVRNPFKCKDFQAVWFREWRVSKNKSIELQYSRYAFNFLEFKLDLNWRQMDHAGPWLTINLFGHTIDLRIYDHRHWNDETNNWATYDTL